MIKVNLWIDDVDLEEVDNYAYFGHEVNVLQSSPQS